jgi:hypothetical protein
MTSFGRLVTFWLLILAFCLLLLSVHKIWLTDELSLKEQGLLITFSLGMLGCAFLLLLQQKLKQLWYFLFFNINLLISLELLSRMLFPFLLSEDTTAQLNSFQHASYPENALYKAHPFLQYTGNPQSPNGKFNRLGFKGEDFIYEKKTGTYRVAALGGSTTERGYPQLLENYLNEHKTKGDSLDFEVYNFGISGWTSAHSLSNLLLNVLDFQPDLLIVHHAWNDVLIRNTWKEKFRNDYSHIYQNFRQPLVPDRYLLRLSMFYRYLKYMYDKEALNHGLETLSTNREGAYRNILPFSDMEELRPFQRNIKSMIKVAHVNEIKVLLSTQPHTHDSTAALFLSAPHIDQCNALLRAIAEADSSVYFLDLDSLISGKRDHLFIDLGHMSKEGLKVKATTFGDKILNEVIQ